MKLPVAYYGHPILRQKSAKVEKIDSTIFQLVKNMEETMFQNKGMGLAAVQVFQPICLFITHLPKMNVKNSEDVEEESDAADWEQASLRIYINPKLSNPTRETWIRPEGCLSIPGPHLDVERPYGITVEATNLEGQQFTEELYGWEARTVMHENDHLNGILYIDRLNKKLKNEIDPFLRKLKQTNKNK